jgi:hypothetical protein
VHAVLFLVLCFFSSAGLWLLLEAEFLAIVLVLVYVGALMVLFLFVVMMLDVDADRLRGGFTRYAPLGPRRGRAGDGDARRAGVEPAASELSFLERRRGPGRSTATPRRWARCCTPTTSTPSSWPRCSCCWRSWPRSR